ncbi:hypothetical protein EWM64_g43 [Hericium alpestre]|uniref:sterol 3beta-glucosyltransferase n=1 Tax=Hericium alpestre TaxID=135208 RepID=A0A4Z0AC97_9AGAM|nr:hypothetical protein EWM64_g43 [Hericium alpestre]
MSRLAKSQIIPSRQPTACASPAGRSSQDESHNDADKSPSTSPRSKIVKRVMERTSEKLGRSKSTEAKSSDMSKSESFAGHRPILSRSRKGKDKQDGFEARNGDEIAGPQHRAQESPARSTPLSEPNDESPFIRPPSPSQHPRRPSLNRFGLETSMRAGTQTLIQALQALPWAEDQDNEDEAINHGNLSPAESDSDDEVKQSRGLSSSIHTIYRPVARSRRAESSFRLPPVRDEAETHPNPEDIAEAAQRAGFAMSDEEIEDDDFEVATPGLSSSPIRQSPTQEEEGDAALTPVMQSVAFRVHPERTGSLATVKTVRLDRRARLAEKLADIFDLSGINEVISEMPCWLLRSILLQGYIYLTNSYLCFFAHMPAREDQVLKSGSMYKKAQRTKRWIRHWFILKNDVLSWYQSSSDPYFPHGVVDLRYAITCDAANEKDIRLRTNNKTIHLSAESLPSRDEWIKAIRKVIFKAQNMGDCVKIAIPYSAIVDVDRSHAMDFSETVEVKVVDGDDQLSIDSYFFAYFHDLPAALEQIRDAVAAARNFISSPNHPQALRIDTTVPHSASVPRLGSSSRLPSVPESTPSRLPTFRLSTLLRPFSDSLPIGRSTSAPEPIEDSNEEFTHVQKRADSSFVPITTSPRSMDASVFDSLSPPSSVTGLPPTDSPEGPGNEESTPTNTKVGYTYPPSTSLQETSLAASRESSSWNVGVPSWLKAASSRRILGVSPSAPAGLNQSATAATDGRGVTEIYSSTLSTSTGKSSNGGNELGYSILEAPGVSMDEEATDKFKAAFAFDDKEKLLGYFPGYLFRLLPVYGRLYISTNYLSFKSSTPLAGKTRMILPLRDLLAVEISKAFRFGHYGLVIIIKGHEELFFEFNQDDRRAAFRLLLDQQLENVRKRQANGETTGQSKGQLAHGFGAAVMFTSTSSTFLTFKPKESLHFTFLTIGSRGDVQPYIALAKGLMADGHRVRIATHGEFQNWVESHGIEFGYVGGDPAELMRICVENGTFTVAFLREGMQKFRGWIDDLLKTSWEACQNTDVLVESPSAMAGYHIAEALRIPYFKAFTMVWSRTRAYPHAFAVPERKMGGSYNYMTYVMFDQIFWRGTAGQINRWRRNTLRLPSTSLDKMEPHKIPFLYNFSPIVVPPPLDWPEWIRVTGYWFLDDADVSAQKWTPPPDLLQFIDNARQLGKKVVYIGFGSIVVSDPKGMTRCVIDAIVRSGVHAILSKGWSDRLTKNVAEASQLEEALPEQIYQISSIPHDWLFRRVDAACHHGGAGTTGASLRAGIPTIIKPFFGDQFFWADRVEALGIGTGVRKLTVESLSDALVSATTDIKQIDRAKMVGENIRAENGVAIAIEAIYRDMDYARSLIKAKRAVDDLSEAEDATIRDNDKRMSSSSRADIRSGDSSAGGAPSEDWSVVSDQDEPSSASRSVSRRASDARQSWRRSGLTAAMLSVLPDALTTGHRRSRSASSLSASNSNA